MNKEALLKVLAVKACQNPKKTLGTALTIAATAGEAVAICLPVVLPIAAVAAAGVGLYKIVKNS